MHKTTDPAVKASVRTRTISFGKTRSLFIKIVQAGRWLSLDVALGAMLSSAMVCRLMGLMPLPWIQLWILGLVVMLIYTLDHLWDAGQMRVIPVTARHYFHYRFRRELSWFAGILFVCTGVASLLLLPARVIAFGLLLAILVALYLWLVNYLPARVGKWWFHKEILIAIGYTTGIWGTVWVQTGAVSTVRWGLAILFGIIALLNLLLFSYYELDEDIVQSQRSVAKTWGKAAVKNVFALLLLLFCLITGLVAYNHLSPVELHVLYIECLMAAVISAIFLFPAFFTKHGRYRWIGDGVFLLPALIFF